MDHDAITFKGIREGLLLTVGDGPFEVLVDSLGGRLTEQGEFFRGGRVALQAAGRILTSDELRQVANLLSSHDLSLWAVLSDSPVTQLSARQAGLATRVPSLDAPRPEPRPEPAPPAEPEGGSGMLLKRTLRSGMSVEHPGHVIIVGDVNAGAHIVAGGDIIVWGRLRGTVHAGALGDESAIVCALDLSPVQLRIATYIARSPENVRRRNVQPEMARVRDGQIMAEYWDEKRR